MCTPPAMVGSSNEATLRHGRNGIAEESVMPNRAPRVTQLTRRRLLWLVGASATAVAAADLTGQGLITSAASPRLQDAPNGDLTIGYDADAYRIDPHERANVATTH
jgi:hypothetical protein